MATVAEERLFGKSIKRREDPRFITGRGQYVDDVKLPGMTYAAFVRSPHAHARLNKVDASAAKKVPGVLAVYTGADVKVGGLPCGGCCPISRCRRDRRSRRARCGMWVSRSRS